MLKAVRAACLNLSRCCTLQMLAVLKLRQSAAISSKAAPQQLQQMPAAAAVPAGLGPGVQTALPRRPPSMTVRPRRIAAGASTAMRQRRSGTCCRTATQLQRRRGCWNIVRCLWLASAPVAAWSVRRMAPALLPSPKSERSPPTNYATPSTHRGCTVEGIHSDNTSVVEAWHIRQRQAQGRQRGFGCRCRRVEVEDSVGAGDSFSAGWLTAYLAGAPLQVQHAAPRP